MKKQEKLITDELLHLKMEVGAFSEEEMLDEKMQKELEFLAEKKPAPKKATPISSAVKLKIKNKIREFYNLAKKQDEITQGHVQLMNFEFLKDHLGNKWDKFRFLIYKKVDSSLEKILTKKDVYLRTSECFYLIAFDENDLKLAKKKLEEVRKDVLEFYLGTDMVKEKEAKKKLKVAASGKIVKSESFLKDMDMINNFFEEKEVDNGKTKSVKVSASDTEEESHWEDRLKYQPFWDAKNGVIVGYQTYLKGVNVGSSCRYILPYQETQICFQDRNKTDIKNLKALIEVVTELHQNKFIFMSMCSLSYTTIRNRKLFRHYVDICKAQRPEIQKLLNIELVECPMGSPSLKLKETVQFLSPYVRNILLNIDLGDLQHYGSFERDNVKIVSLDMSALKEVEGIAAFSKLMKGIYKKLSEVGVEIYLIGVKDPEVAIEAHSIGVRYMSGPLIGRPREFPKHMARFTLPGLNK